MLSFPTNWRPLVIITTALCCQTIGCSERQPTVQTESPEEKRDEVVRSFSGAAVLDGDQQTRSLEDFFSRCSEALGSADVDEFRSVFDSRMALQLMKQQQLVPAAILSDEDHLVAILDQQMSQRLADPVTGVSWKRHEIRNVQFIKEDSEAIVYVRHWDADDVASKMRWWLMREGNRWRAYDFEILEVAMRYSTMMGIGFKMADQSDPSAQRLPELLMAVQTGATGDSDSALTTLQNLEDAGFPPAMEGLRLMMLAACLSDTGQYSEALEVSVRATAANADIPLLHLVDSACHNGLGRHQQALDSADQYADVLGEDGEYFAEVGNAYAGLGETDKAIESYRNGLEDDSQSGMNVLGLIRLTAPDQIDSVARYYRALNDINEWFVAFAEEALRTEDRQAMETLILLHRDTSPDDDNIAVYEEALADLPQAP
jgi:tetratricopeptide (TPR) repeat protein